MIHLKQPQIIQPNQNINFFDYKGVALIVSKFPNGRWKGIYDKHGFLADKNKIRVDASTIYMARKDGIKYIGDTSVVNYNYFPRYGHYNLEEDVAYYSGHNRITFDNSKLSSSSGYSGAIIFNLLFNDNFLFSLNLENYENIDELSFIDLTFSDKRLSETKGRTYYQLKIRFNTNKLDFIIYNNGTKTTRYINYISKILSLIVRKESNICEILYKDVAGEHSIYKTRSETGFVFGFGFGMYAGTADQHISFTMAGEATYVSPLYILSTWMGDYYLKGIIEYYKNDFDYDEIIAGLFRTEQSKYYISLYEPSGETIMKIHLISMTDLNLNSFSYDNGVLMFKGSGPDYGAIGIVDFSNGYSYELKYDTTTNETNIHKSPYGCIPFYKYPYSELYRNKIDNKFISNDIKEGAVYEFNRNVIASLSNGNVFEDIDKAILINSIYGSSCLIENKFSDSTAKAVVYTFEDDTYVVLPDSLKSDYPFLKINKLSYSSALGVLETNLQNDIFFKFNPGYRIEDSEIIAGRKLILIASKSNNKYYFKCKILQKIDGGIKILVEDGQLQLPYDTAAIILSDDANTGVVKSDTKFVNTSSYAAVILNKDKAALLASDEAICFYKHNTGSIKTKFLYNFVNERIDDGLLNVNGCQKNGITVVELNTLRTLKFDNQYSRIAIPYPFDINNLNLQVIIVVNGIIPLNDPGRNIVSLESSIKNNSFRIYVKPKMLNNKYMLSLYMDPNILLLDNIDITDKIGIAIKNGKILSSTINKTNSIGISSSNFINVINFGYDSVLLSYPMSIYYGHISVTGADMSLLPEHLRKKTPHKTLYTIKPWHMTLLNNNNILSYCENNQDKAIISIFDLTGNELIQTEQFNGNTYSSFTSASDDKTASSSVLTCINNNYLYHVGLSSEFDDLYENNPIPTEPYERYIAEVDIDDGEGLVISELKRRLYQICSTSDNPYVATRCVLMYAFRDYEFLFSPLIDRNIILKTRTKKLVSYTSTGEIEKLYTRFISSKYSVVSNAFVSQIMSKKTPKSSLSLMCGFLVWRYIYEYNRLIS